MTLKRIRASIAAKAATPAKAPRADGWKNLATNLGVAGFDARLAGAVELQLYAQDEAEVLWRADDFAARIVEKVPDEMTREGWRLSIDGSTAPDTTKPVTSRLDELEFDAAVNEALRYERAYGGGAILLGADDGQRDWGRPLLEDRVRSLDYFTVLTPRECQPVAWYEDPRAPKFGRPKLYQVCPDVTAGPTLIVVHESRLLPFYGAQTSRRAARLSAQLWGDSVFVRCADVIRDFQNSFGSSFALLKDFSQAVLKIKGLAELVASEDPEDAARFRARVQAFDYTKSMVRTALLDSEEDYERKATPMTGLPDLLDRFAFRMAAAADMPVSLLMGQAPAGLNATGDSDIRWFYDRVRAVQRRVLRPRISRVVKLTMTALGVKEPEGWAVTFNPLWQLDGLQISQMRKTIADTDEKYLSLGVLSPQEVRASRFGQDEFGTEVQLDAATEAALLVPDTAEEPAEKETAP